MIQGASAGASPYFLQNHQLFHALDGMESSAAAFMPVTGATGSGEQVVATVSDTHFHTLLYNLSVLKDKVQQLQPLVGLAVAQDGSDPVCAVTGASAIIQEIITAASSMMYAFQQLCVGTSTSTMDTATAAQDHISFHHGHAKNGTAASNNQVMDHHVMQQLHHQGSYDNKHSNTTEPAASSKGQADMIIELDAAELLAKYTHYCQVCGKGFKRDANLRMHMRAHGDEYKTNAALANPIKANYEDRADVPAVAGRKYSCPQEGCRWNRKHAKFQPLKSVICVKNHYKRSHCPKMYVCNRCNRKQFSVLSDLRTHEKHCGDRRWLCSCGTAFSRKDKLMGHVALFTGHAPAVPLHCAGAKHGKRPEHGSGSGNGVGMR